MQNQQTPEAATRSARRRLIKGGFAVPAALTLSSGSAFAAGSTAARCVKNAADLPDLPSPGITDSLIRVQAYSTGAGADAYAFVKGADVAAKLGASTGVLAILDGAGAPLSSTTVLCVVGQTKAPPDVIANRVYPTPATSTGTGVYYAILVDANGRIVGISTVSTAVGGAVSNDCWQSFGGLV